MAAHQDPSQDTLAGDEEFDTRSSTPTIVSDAESVLEPPVQPASEEKPEKPEKPGKTQTPEKPDPSDPTAEPSSEAPLSSEPPDGGLTAWLQVLAGHLVVFNTWGYIISFGIFQPYYAARLNTPPSAIAWIGSVQICLIFLVGATSGRAFDAGYYRHALVLGSVLQLVGILATSFADTYIQLFLAQGLCQGLGCGIVFAPTIANMSTYFTRKRSMAISTSGCGGGTGGMVFPLMAQQLMPRIGFHWTVRAMGLVVLVTSVVVLVIVRTRLPPRRSGPLVEVAAFKEPTYVLFSISMFFVLWAAYFVYYYARAYAIDTLGASQSTSFTMLLIINAIGIPGRLVPAYLADRYFGAVFTFIPIVFASAVCVFAWAGVSNLAGDYAWLLVYGFFGAAIQVMFPSALAGLSTDLSKNGTRIGMVFTIVSIAALTGPPLAGKLIEVAGGSYIAAQMWGGTCLVLGGALLCAAKWVDMRDNKGRRW